MSAQPKLNEPTMEEILASIRKIIADDQAVAAKVDPAPAPQPAPPPAPRAPEAPAPAAAPAILDLAVEATPLDAPGQSQDDIDLLFSEIEEEPPAPEPARIEAPRSEPPRPEPARPEPLTPPPAANAAPEPAWTAPPATAPLMSHEASASIAGAFSSLSTTLLSQNARTLEDLVREMLRPMLKSWLDDNLPVLVERLVRAEIERVTRGPR